MVQRIFFSVGEPSGDQHTARLIGELRRRHPGLRFRGFGGPEMRQAGCQLDFELTELAVMGVIEVLPMLRKFFRLADQAEEAFRVISAELQVQLDQLDVLLDEKLGEINEMGKTLGVKILSERGVEKIKP